MVGANKKIKVGHTLDLTTRIVRLQYAPCCGGKSPVRLYKAVAMPSLGATAVESRVKRLARKHGLMDAFEWFNASRQAASRLLTEAIQQVEREHPGRLRW
jgi:hypothetical protein